MEPKIIYQDNSLMVLDKPVGWIVTKAKTAKDTPVIEDWLKKFKYPLSGDESLRRGIVHRIDKETSGLILIAKTKESLEKLQQEFKEREVEKEYLALVHGKLFPEEGIIQAPLGRLPWNRKRFGILPGGRESQTNYKVEGYYKYQQEVLSLVSLFPKSGRTHQIRVHLKYISHPIVSDVFYGGRKVSKRDRLWCPRLFLHARRIKFMHPKDLKSVEFEAELPDDLKTVLKNLQTLS